MRRSTSYAAFIPPFVRRRTRTSLLCTAVLLLVIFTFLHNPSSDRSSSSSADSESTGKPFLEVINFPWPQSTRKPATPPGRFPGGASSEEYELIEDEDDVDVDEIPDIPPTLQEEDEDEDEDEEEYIEDDLPAHTYRPDGLLVTNPEGAHPIYELIERAEREWAEKHKRASRTLEEAVEEYERRYKRPPPLGFNHWWDYVQRHDVQLPDEYDGIHDDLEPYWGISPHDLQEMQLEWEGHRDSFTIGKNAAEDVITVLNVSLNEPERTQDYMAWGAKPQLDALTEVHQYIPPFRAVFSPHDNPNIMADWTWRHAAIEAAKEGKFVKPEHLPLPVGHGWQTMCAPNSAMGANPVQIGDEPTPQTEKTFIYDHKASMDPCAHPQHLLLHGQFLSADVPPIPARFAGPQFSFCKTTLHGDVRATSMAQASARMDDDAKWDDKDDDRLFWRGTLTGMWHRDGVSWWQSQRLRLVNATRTSTPELEQTRNGLTFDPLARVSVLRPTSSRSDPVGAPAELARRKLNSALMDVSLVAEPKGCEVAQCAAIKRAFKFGAYVPAAVSANKYKYVLDVDGNGWSARFRRLMSTHALVFKATLYPEWWAERAQPWVHYVPVQLDYSDLVDSLVFFAGDMSGEGAHEEMGRKIAEAGREWVRKYWREEDVTAYMFRLWLEYARVMSLDRNDMNFYLPSENQ